MATEKILDTRILLKYDSYANWTNEVGKAFVLKKGEVGICAIPADNTAVNGDMTRPQILFKVGDGTSTFENLPWASALAADVYAWAKQASLPVTKEGTGNVVSSITWDEATKGIKFTTASVATSEGLGKVQEDLAALTEKVNAMYTNDQIDTAVADAKKAGTDAAAALEEYKTSNNAALALKASQAALEEEIARAKAAEKVNADAITLLTDGVDQEKVDGVRDLIQYVEDHGTEVTGMKDDIAANAEAIGINTQAIADEKSRAEGVEEGLETRLKAAEDELATYGDIVTHNASEFATNEQGAKADTAIQEVAAGTGLKVTTSGTTRTVDFDNEVIFVLNGGSSTEVI